MNATLKARMTAQALFALACEHSNWHSQNDPMSEHYGIHVAEHPDETYGNAVELHNMAHTLLLAAGVTQSDVLSAAKILDEECDAQLHPDEALYTPPSMMHEYLRMTLATPECPTEDDIAQYEAAAMF